MRVITQEDIKKINELYAQYKTYAAVARETGISPGTVKKYVQKDYIPKAERTYIRFSRPLPEFNPTIFHRHDWGPLCVLSDYERKKETELWEELDVCNTLDSKKLLNLRINLY